MPTTFIQSFGSYICAPTFVMGLVYFGISYVGSELSDPFGHDTNDIHLEAFHRQIEEDLGYYIMQWSLLPALAEPRRSPPPGAEASRASSPPSSLSPPSSPWGPLGGRAGAGFLGPATRHP